VPPRAKTSEPVPRITVEVIKEDVYYVWVVDSQPPRFTYASTIGELPERVAAMLPFMGLQGAVEVEWTGGDEAGRRAVRKIQGRETQIESDAS
jgi:hypothetical protein